MSTESGASTPLDQRLGRRLPAGSLAMEQTHCPTAQRAHIDLTNEHWRIIDLLRNYYAHRHRTGHATTGKAGANRDRQRSGQPLPNAVVWRQRRMAAKLAGLPRPTNCI